LLSDPGARVFVAEDGGTVVGLAAMSTLLLLERDRPLCRLTSLIVAPGARGHGVGHSLLERVESEASELGCDRLEVTSRADREDAQAFYVNLGFEETPRRFVKDLTLAPRTLLSRARRRR
jgi:ribosomal protein S18 acetylase RimI-like enzyme